MRSFAVCVLVLAAMVGSAQMQNPYEPQQNGRNLLGNLLGGLGLSGRRQQGGGGGGLLDGASGLLGGLGSPGQQQQAPGMMGGGGGTGNGGPGDLLSGLLGGLSPNRMNSMDGMGRRPGMNNQDQLMGQFMNQPGMNQPGMNQPGMYPPGMYPPGMNQNNLGQMLAQLPQRSLELVQHIMDGVGRMLTGQQIQQQMPMNQQMNQQMNRQMSQRLDRQMSQQGLPMGQQGQGQGLLSSLPSLPSLDGVTNALTQPLSQGRLPDMNRVTGELTRSLSGLTQGLTGNNSQGGRLQQQTPQPPQLPQPPQQPIRNQELP